VHVGCTGNGGTVVKVRVQLVDGQVEVFGLKVRMDVCGEKTGLHDVSKRVLQVCHECIRTGLTYAIDGDGVIFIGEVRDCGIGSYQCHYLY
jgi:hypothetical protein